MALNFITSNPALDAFQKAEKEKREALLDEARTSLLGGQAEFQKLAMPSQLRSVEAGARSAETEASVGARTAEPRIEQAGVGLEQSRTNLGSSQVEAGVQRDMAGTRVQTARSNLANVQAGQFEKARGLAESGDEQAAQDYQKITGAPLSQGSLNEARIKNAIAVINKRTEELYGKDRPELQQRYREARLKELKASLATGELVNDPIQQQMMPEGAPPVVSTEKPVNVKPGEALYRPNTGDTVYQNRSGIFSPEVLDTLADQYMTGDTSVFQNLGRGAQNSQNIEALRGRITEKLTARGQGGADQAAAIANLRAQAAAARTAAVREGNVQSSVEEARLTFPLALDASAKVSRTDFVPFNRAVQAVQRGFSSPELAQFVTATQGVITAYSQAMSRTGTNTVHAQQAAEALLSTATSPEAYAAVLAQMEKEMQAAVHAPEAVRNAILQRISGRGQPTPVPGVPGATYDRPEIGEARTAIARGASREMVMQRLREKGISFDPKDLD